MLVNCVVYRDGRKLQDIRVEDISDQLNTPGAFVWVALRDPKPEELARMQVEFSLHDLAVEDARSGNQRPKVEEYGSTVFCAMHAIEFTPTDQLRVGEVDVFAGPNFVLSVRSQSSQSLLGVRDRCELEPDLLKHGSGFVFYAVMDAVVDRYFPIIDALEDELESIEGRIFDQGAGKENIKRLYELKSRIMVVKHAVSPLREAVGKLWSGRVPQVCQHSRDYFRDVYDHLERINATLDTARETIGTAIQVNLSMVAIEESETTKRLAAWAGIFAVATAFAGLWGMNFKNMPELEWRYGYPVALSVIVTTCGVLYWRFRKSGWL